MTSRPAATCSPAGLRRSASRSTGPTAPTSSPPTSPPWARRTRWSSAWRCPTGPVWSPSRAPSSTTTTRRPGAPWSGSRSASGRRCSRRRSAGSPSWAAQAAERGGLSRWRPGRPAARMDRMTTTSGGLSVTGRLRRLRASWPAPLPSLVRIAPFALFGYGAYGIWLMHSLLAYETGSAFYGFVHATRAAYPAFRSSRGMWLVLTQALACLVAGVWLLAWTAAPGGGAAARDRQPGQDGARAAAASGDLPLAGTVRPASVVREPGLAGLHALAARDRGADFRCGRDRGPVVSAYRRDHGGGRDHGVRALRAGPAARRDGPPGGAVLRRVPPRRRGLHGARQGAGRRAGGGRLRARPAAADLGSGQRADGAGAGARPAGRGPDPAGGRPDQDPQRRDGDGGRRAAPDRAGPARRGAGPAGRGRNVAAGGRAADRHPSRGGAGAGRGGAGNILTGPRRPARPGARHLSAGAGRSRPGRGGAEPGPGHVDRRGAEGRPAGRAADAGRGGGVLRGGGGADQRGPARGGGRRRGQPGARRRDAAGGAHRRRARRRRRRARHRASRSGATARHL